MSALIVAHDFHLVLLEIAVEKLYMPWIDAFDAALMKKTIIMFRMLDDEWTTLTPNRRDYRSYRGSSSETEYFYGGQSVLFSLPEAVFKQQMSGVDLQLYVYRSISKYFELESRRNFGIILIRMDNLFNGIIKDLGERKALEGYFSRDLEREPISRSTRGTFTLLDDDLQETKANIELYLRISYLGKSIINEMYTPASIEKAFYVREETDEHYRYQFRELNIKDLESFCWGSRTILPPLDTDKLLCDCKPEAEQQTDSGKKKVRRKRKRHYELGSRFDLAGKLSRVQELLARLKELRKNRAVGLPGQGLGLIERAIAPDCTSSAACRDTCQPMIVCCIPPPCCDVN